MELNEKQFDFVADQLERHNAFPPLCRCGQSTKWNCGEICEVRFDEDDLLKGRAIIPLVILKCSGCGATHFFNAITLGIIDPETGKLNGPYGT